MRANIFEIARLAKKALQPKAPEPKIRGRIIKDYCEICHKTHGFILGSPRCTTPSCSRENPAFDPIFGKVLAAALLAGCMALSGCAHFYCSGVNVGVEQTSDGKEFTAGLSFAPNPYSYAIADGGKEIVPLDSTAK